MLNQGQEGLADYRICDPVTGCSCTPTQTPQLHVGNIHIGSMQCSWIRVHAHVLTAAAAKSLLHWGLENGKVQFLQPVMSFEALNNLLHAAWLQQQRKYSRCTPLTLLLVG